MTNTGLCLTCRLTPKTSADNTMAMLYASTASRARAVSGFLMERRMFGYSLPKEMREDFGYCVKGVSDHERKELQPDDMS